MQNTIIDDFDHTKKPYVLTFNLINTELMESTYTKYCIGNHFPSSGHISCMEPYPSKEILYVGLQFEEIQENQKVPKIVFDLRKRKVKGLHFFTFNSKNPSTQETLKMFFLSKESQTRTCNSWLSLEINIILTFTVLRTNLL